MKGKQPGGEPRLFLVIELLILNTRRDFSSFRKLAPKCTVRKLIGIYDGIIMRRIARQIAQHALVCVHTAGGMGRIRQRHRRRDIDSYRAVHSNLRLIDARACRREIAQKRNRGRTEKVIRPVEGRPGCGCALEQQWQPADDFVNQLCYKHPIFCLLTQKVDCSIIFNEQSPFYR